MWLLRKIIEFLNRSREEKLMLITMTAIVVGYALDIIRRFS